MSIWKSQGTSISLDDALIIKFLPLLSFLLNPIVSFSNAVYVSTAIFGTVQNSAPVSLSTYRRPGLLKENYEYPAIFKRGKQTGMKPAWRAWLSVGNHWCLHSHHFVKTIKKRNKMATTNIQINKDSYDSQLLTISGNPYAVFVPSVVYTIPIFVSASQSGSK